MRRFIIGTVFCFILSIGMYYADWFHFGWESVTTLYTIVGIIFSVGMSLIISISTSEIRNREAKTMIRKKIQNVTRSYVGSFLVISIFFIFFDVKNSADVTTLERTFCLFKYIELRNSDFLVLSLVFCILFHIGNFIAIQDMNRSIEDTIEKEREG